ncbi:hypothetical protein TURU_159713 [Turdus rufiventris]|nr:hypothetical protein TURU_159713 [Turdus rufiventris]
MLLNTFFSDIGSEIDCPIRKLAEKTKLRGVMDMSEEQDVIQKDLDKNWSYEARQCQVQNPVPVSGVNSCQETSGLREDKWRRTWRYRWIKHCT